MAKTYTPQSAAAHSRRGPKESGGYKAGTAASQVAGGSGKGIEKCHCSGKPGMHGDMAYKQKGRN